MYNNGEYEGDHLHGFIFEKTIKKSKLLALWNFYFALSCNQHCEIQVIYQQLEFFNQT